MLSSLLPLFSFNHLFPPQDSEASDEPRKTGTTVSLSLLLLASGCGLLIGWYGRGWSTRRRCAAYTHRKGRQYNPLWLLPAPLMRSSGSLQAWFVAGVVHRWLPAFFSSPPLLRYYGVTYAADSLETQAADEARNDAVRWGTRVLTCLHNPHSVAALEGGGSFSGKDKNRTLPAWLSGIVEWECLPSYSVDVFTCLDSPADITTTACSMSVETVKPAESTCAAALLSKENAAASVSSSPSSAQQLLRAPLRVLPRHNFSLLYDPTTRLALWCGYHLTRTCADRARRQRRCLTVYTDRSLEKAARRVPAEVKARGYDRGHLAPHASVAATTQSALEATLLTNIHLQHREINRGVWRWLEAATRAYVRIPYDYNESGSATMAKSVKSRLQSKPKRKDGMLLARLMAKGTPFASLQDAQGTARRVALWGRRMLGKVEEGRHLCVNVGPLYYTTPASSSSFGDGGCCKGEVKRRMERVHTITTNAAVRRRRGRPSKRTPSVLSPHALQHDKNTKKTATGLQATSFIPDAFFLSLWDAHTHHHLNLVIPNTPATPQMHTLTQALAASAATSSKQSSSRRRRPIQHHRGTTSVEHTCVHRTLFSAASASVDGTAATPNNNGDTAVEVALAAFAVSTESLEELFATSVVELRMRWAASQPDLALSLLPRQTTVANKRSGIVANVAPSSNVQLPTTTLTLRTPLRFFPAYHEQWVWQTRWHQLAHYMSPKLLLFKRRSKNITVCR